MALHLFVVTIVNAAGFAVTPDANGSWPLRCVKPGDWGQRLARGENHMAWAEIGTGTRWNQMEHRRILEGFNQLWMTSDDKPNHVNSLDACLNQCRILLRTSAQVFQPYTEKQWLSQSKSSTFIIFHQHWMYWMICTFFPAFQKTTEIYKVVWLSDLTLQST